MLPFWRLCAIVSACWLLVIFTVSNGRLWSDRFSSSLSEHVQQASQLSCGDTTDKGDDPAQPETQEDETSASSDAADNWRQLYPIREKDSDGGDFSRTLVVASLANESTTWIHKELGDIIAPNGPLSTAVYIADNISASLHPLENKGHEANVYLTYIIDEYDSLPDIAIFMHAHQTSWHNNDLLVWDAALMIRNLSPNKVVDDGYVNLRCHWDPGCPDWIHPDNLEEDDYKQEEHIIAAAWHELFPNEDVPNTLAQPCCSQFALTGERIRQLSRDRYIQLRDWIHETEYSDSVAGRVFEYVWQYLFTHEASYCPDQGTCYCELYGVCFETGNGFDGWAKISDEVQEITDAIEEQEEASIEECGTKDCEDVDQSELLERKVVLEADLERRARLAFNAGRRIRGLSVAARLANAQSVA